MKKTLYLLLALLSSSAAFSQQERTLYFMRDLPQTISYNPAIDLNYKVAVVLPGVSGGYAGFSNNGFGVGNVVQVDGSQASISLGELSRSIKDKNWINGDAAVHTLGVYVNNDDFSVHFRIRERVMAQLQYPRDLIDLVYKGNGHPDYLGRTMNLAPEGSILHYREFALGGSYKVNPKLRVGASLKYLKGVSSIRTDGLEVNLTSESGGSYPTTISTEGKIVTAGISTFIDSEDVGDYLNTEGNSGFAIDLGAVYQFNERITLEASILNLGGISWKNEIEDYGFENQSASYTFSGIDAVAAFKEDEGGAELDEAEQNLESVFEWENNGEGTPGESFFETLPTSIRLAGRYQMEDGLQAGALVSTRHYKGQNQVALTLMGAKDFGRWANFSLSYSLASRSAFNLGFGFSINLPVQIHFVSDNLLSSVLAPNALREINARVGINLVFGHRE